MAVLVVVIFVMLVQVAHFLVVLFQSLTGTGGNPVLFVLVDFRLGSSGGPLIPFRPFATAASAPSAAATPTAAILSLCFFDAAGASGTLFALYSKCVIEVFDGGENIVPVQIDIQIQVEIKAGRSRLFAPGFVTAWGFVTANFFAAGRTIITAWSRRTFVAAAAVFAARRRPFFAARFFSSRRRGLVASWWRSVITSWRRRLVAATFGPPTLLAPLAAA